MDQYANNNGIPTSSSYSSLPSIAPQQLQQNTTLPPHTLPPLQQGQHAALSMHSIYGQPLSAPHTPTSTQPNTPGSTGNNGGYQQMGGQPGPRSYHLQNGPYQQPMQSYNGQPAMMPQSSGSMSHPHPQAIAPAPGPSHNRLVPLRPMNPSAPMHQQHAIHSQMQGGMGSPYGQQAPGQEEAPTHVVGSQGRRGILPSAPGRPAVTATGPGASKNAMIPAKDADGKFPCPHCVKTYLHAKHLKRHLLRHTGDRPYMCVLCRDTFSRSDILKRHFQKCSIRRGNPTGASHLSHAQAHLKKSHPGPHKSSASVSAEGGDMMRTMNGMNGLPTDPSLHPFGMIPDGRIPDTASNMTDEQVNQDHLSRSNSIKKEIYSNDGRDRRGMSGPARNGTGRPGYDQNYNGDIPSSMSSLNPQLAAYNMPNGHNGTNFSQNYEYPSQSNGTGLHPPGNEEMPAMANGRGPMPMYGGGGNGQQSNLDWSQMFQPGAQDGFMSPYNSSLVQNQMAIKAEPSSHAQPADGYFNGMYPVAGAGPEGTTGNAGNFPSWNFSASQHNPIQQIANHLVNFCFSAGSSSQTSELRNFITPDNIKHFLEQYTNFQGHFPIIHMPTFRITDGYAGLLLAMICIGAVYSDRMRPSQVRELMELTKLAIERDSRVFSVLARDPADVGYANETIGVNKTDLEEIQSIVLIQLLFTFHGTPIQREVARRNYPMLRRISQMARLTRPSTSSQSFSVLHQHSVIVEHFNAANFDWSSWVEQEKRSRLFYLIFLLDSAMVIYFNSPPLFDGFDVSLPLPADDAAWDAWSAIQCAEALGLHGPATSKSRNPDGSRRPKQPEMSSALKALMDGNLSLKPGTTNVFSKFILIHALHVQLWCFQKQLAQEKDNASRNGNGSDIGTPNSQNDRGGRSPALASNGQPTPNSSQRQTPETQTQHYLMLVNNALEKWKKTWDDDMASQYPPSSKSYRRFGFCRDGVHFFYLAKWLMKTGLDWQMAPDQRFTHVIHLLKSVKSWVVSDSAKRGEELGSVGDIDQAYGVTDLTLDMSLLFKPINKQVDSNIAGVHTNIGGGMI